MENEIAVLSWEGVAIFGFVGSEEMLSPSFAVVVVEGGGEVVVARAEVPLPPGAAELDATLAPSSSKKSR